MKFARSKQGASLLLAAVLALPAGIVGSSCGAPPSGVSSTPTPSSPSVPSSTETSATDELTTEVTRPLFDAAKWQAQAEGFAGIVNGYSLGNDYRTREPSPGETSKMPEGVWHVDIVDARPGELVVDFAGIFFGEEALRHTPEGEEARSDVYVSNERRENTSLKVQAGVVVLLQQPDMTEPYAHGLTVTDYGTFLSKFDPTAVGQSGLGYDIFLSTDSSVWAIVEVYSP